MKQQNNKVQKLYIIHGIDEKNVKFAPIARNEIGRIEWVKIKKIVQEQANPMFKQIFPLIESLEKLIEKLKDNQKVPNSKGNIRENLFESRLNEIQKKIELKTQARQEENPFKAFQLNKNKLMSAFRVKLFAVE
eukprot:TRINITY_DN39150_c0_g1_i1.p3 TRINITY_DN39150_c0_g1~~TRINITY_DN39150_c0_g1_i1.p3  ORF type:complete len:134 (-),score=32.48 TRINITY_DN39150_c0_g1_i1:108-509(-)